MSSDTLEQNKFVCQFPNCQKAFQFKSLYERHLLSHQSSKSKTCHICHKSFKRQDALDVHKKQHTRENLYQCDDENCTQLFPSKSALRYHVLKFHDQNKIHRCECCNKSYLTLAQLKQHLNTKSHLKRTKEQAQASSQPSVTTTADHSTQTTPNAFTSIQNLDDNGQKDTLINQIWMWKQSQENKCDKQFSENMLQDSFCGFHQPMSQFSHLKQELILTAGLFDKLKESEPNSQIKDQSISSSEPKYLKMAVNTIQSFNQFICGNGGASNCFDVNDMEQQQADQNSVAGQAPPNDNSQLAEERIDDPESFLGENQRSLEKMPDPNGCSLQVTKSQSNQLVGLDPDGKAEDKLPFYANDANEDLHQFQEPSQPEFDNMSQLRDLSGNQLMQFQSNSLEPEQPFTLHYSFQQIDPHQAI